MVHGHRASCLPVSSLVRFSLTVARWSPTAPRTTQTTNSGTTPPRGTHTDRSTAGAAQLSNRDSRVRMWVGSTSCGVHRSQRIHNGQLRAKPWTTRLGIGFLVFFSAYDTLRGSALGWRCAVHVISQPRRKARWSGESGPGRRVGAMTDGMPTRDVRLNCLWWHRRANRERSPGFGRGVAHMSSVDGRFRGRARRHGPRRLGT